MDISKDEIKEYGYCLSLMRHHGAPTRFLDWTYSFFNALYFAINRLNKESSYVVWAINDIWLTKKVSEILKKDKDVRKILNGCDDKDNFDLKNDELFKAFFLEKSL